MSVVRVLIADDSDAFRGALHELVEATPGFVLVAEADSGEAAVAAAKTSQPDLALLDVRMPGLGGVWAAEQILAAFPDAAVVMITADSGRQAIEDRQLVVADKRSLNQTVLIDLWESARRR